MFLSATFVFGYFFNFIVIFVQAVELAHVNEHLFWDKKTHIFKHFSASKGCRDKCDLVLRFLIMPALILNLK